MSKFGEQVKKARLERSMMSQSRLAGYAATDPSTIADVELGIISPGFDLAKRIASALDREVVNQGGGMSLVVPKGGG